MTQLPESPPIIILEDDKTFEERITRLLVNPSEANPVELGLALQTLFWHYRAQQRLLDRVTHLSDRYQRAERDRGMSYADRYQKKIRQIEKIVRISDQYQAMLHDINDRLLHVSTHDVLTNLPNRRCIIDRMAAEMARATRQEGSFSVALADIDHFKEVNDGYGHAVGDAVLVHLAGILGASLREYDLCARWGGEEFLLLFPGVGLQAAVSLAERVRLAVHNDCNSPNRPETLPVFSLSFGVAAYYPGETSDMLLYRADQALYQAKAAGRNCTKAVA